MSSSRPNATFQDQRDVQVAEARARGGLARFLLFILLTYSVVIIGFFSAVVYWRAREDIRGLVKLQLESIAQLKEAQLDEWASSRAANVNNLARSPEILASTQKLIVDKTDAGVRETLGQILDDFNKNNEDVDNLLLIDAESGEVLYTTDPRNLFLGSLKTEEWFPAVKRSALLIPPRYDSRFAIGEIAVLTAAPVIDPRRGPIAILLGSIRKDYLQGILGSGAVLGRSGIAYLVSQDGYIIGNEVHLNETPKSEAITATVTLNSNGSGEYANYAGVRVLGAYRWFDRYSIAIIVEQNETEAYNTLTNFTYIMIGVLVLVLLITAGGIILLTRYITRPLQTLTESALSLASGDLNANVNIRRQDEIGLLGRAFNSMARELRDLYQGLESKVEARTKQLALAAEVGRAATSILSAEELLGQAVELISQRFGYYHVSVFLIDETGQYAILREASGEVGVELKKRTYRLAVGSNSLIGWVTAHKKPRVSLEVEADPLHHKEELLSETRSEAVVPLRAGERVIGALDVQSREPNGFTQADVDVLQILADQIAVAVENGRLFARQERAAQLEQRIATISSKIHQSLSLNTILENTAVELGQLFGARKVVVRLSPETRAATALPQTGGLNPDSAPALVAPASAAQPTNGDPANLAKE